MLPLWYGGSMSYYVYDGSGLSVVCLSVFSFCLHACNLHHLTTEQISTIKLDQYTLGASFCRQTYNHGGTCIYVLKDIQFHTIDLDQFNTEKDLKIWALRSSLTSCNHTIIFIYRSLIGNFNYFLNQLETVLSKLHKTSTELFVVTLM